MVAGVSDSDRRVTPPAGTHNHTQLLTWASMAARCWTWALVVLASRLPLFDSSPTVLLPGVGWFTASLLRWDTFHYARIALRGYEYEYQWAHFPGTPVVMRGVGHIIHTLKHRSIDASLPWDEILLGGSSCVMMLASSRTLYDLSLHHLKSHHLAFVTSVLSLLPSSPVTLLLAPGAEPFFTFLSYRGMLHCAREHWWRATMYFTLAACFRSNGVLSGGFVIWGLVIRPHLELRQAPDLHRTAKAALLACAICLPSVIYQLIAYKVFCAGDRAPEFAWCRNTIPSIYSHVQSAYWNVGFLRYWTLSQLPNILLASPVLMLLFTFCARHMRTEIPRIAANLSQRDPAQHIKPLQSEPFLDPGITPHAIHAFIMCSVLLFASHTQIALRLAASMPLTYWAAAWLLVKHPAWGRAWVGWSIVWGTISIVLWAAFLPPA